MIGAILTGAVMAALSSTVALQGPSPTTSTQAIAGGPVIPGVCVLSPEAILSGSKVGQAAQVRLKQIVADAQSQLQAEKSSLENEAKTLQSQSKALSATSLEQRQASLAQRAKSLQAQSELRNRELDATRIHVIQRISQQAEPLISSAYTAHSCGLLFRRDDVLGGNLANDLTGEVVNQLNAKLTTLEFNLEPLPPPKTIGKSGV